jgi:integral membrane protein (TIGR01906 family)
MVGLAGVIAVVVVVGMFVIPDLFWKFFEGFHAIFFEGDSWLFLFSDTLIRLFPIRFWQDAFLFAALIAVAGGLGLALGIKRNT